MDSNSGQPKIQGWLGAPYISGRLCAGIYVFRRVVCLAIKVSVTLSRSVCFSVTCHAESSDCAKWELRKVFASVFWLATKRCLGHHICDSFLCSGVPYRAIHTVLTSDRHQVAKSRHPPCANSLMSGAMRLALLLWFKLVVDLSATLWHDADKTGLICCELLVSLCRHPSALAMLRLGEHRKTKTSESPFAADLRVATRGPGGARPR